MMWSTMVLKPPSYVSVPNHGLTLTAMPSGSAFLQPQGCVGAKFKLDLEP